MIIRFYFSVEYFKTKRNIQQHFFIITFRITPSKKKNETNSHFSYGLVADKKKFWNAKRPKFLFGRCNNLSNNHNNKQTYKTRFNLV